MSDRTQVLCWIAGEATTLRDIIRLYWAVLDKDEEVAESFYWEALLAHVNKEQLQLDFNDVNYGDTREIEDAAINAGMSYYVHQGQGSEYPEEHRCYVCGVHDLTTVVCIDGDPAILVRQLRAVRDDPEALLKLIHEAEQGDGEHFTNLVFSLGVEPLRVLKERFKDKLRQHAKAKAEKVIGVAA